MCLRFEFIVFSLLRRDMFGVLLMLGARIVVYVKTTLFVLCIFCMSLIKCVLIVLNIFVLLGSWCVMFLLLIKIFFKYIYVSWILSIISTTLFIISSVFFYDVIVRLKMEKNLFVFKVFRVMVLFFNVVNILFVFFNFIMLLCFFLNGLVLRITFV